VLGTVEALDRQGLRGDEQATVGSDARDRLEERDGRDLRADLSDATIERLDELLEPVGDAFVRAYEALLLGPEEGPSRGVNPTSSLSGEESAARQAESYGMELGVDARGGLGT
jgi:hypothetical protein